MGNKVEKVLWFHLRVGDVDRNGVFVKPLQQCVDEGGFSRSDIAGNKKEALVIYGNIFQNRKDVLVALAKPDKFWIHVYLKRLFF